MDEQYEHTSIKALNEKITENVEELRNRFAKLKTNQERIKFFLNVMLEYDTTLPTTGRPKNAKKSEKLRNKGNAVFNEASDNMKYIEALKLYTKSIAFAPNDSEQLALGYAYRSEVLLRLGLHS